MYEDECGTRRNHERRGARQQLATAKAMRDEADQQRQGGRANQCGSCHGTDLEWIEAESQQVCRKEHAHESVGECAHAARTQQHSSIGGRLGWQPQPAETVQRRLGAPFAQIAYNSRYTPELLSLSTDIRRDRSGGPLVHVDPLDRAAGDVLRRQGPCEQVTLATLTLHVRQQRELLVGFDSLRRHGQTQRFSQLQHAPDDCRVLHVIAQTADKGSIDFERIEWKLLQIGERRIPRAKVINRQLYTESLQLVEGLHGGLSISHYGTLGN